MALLGMTARRHGSARHPHVLTTAAHWCQESMKRAEVTAPRAGCCSLSLHPRLSHHRDVYVSHEWARFPC